MPWLRSTLLFIGDSFGLTCSDPQLSHETSSTEPATEVCHRFHQAPAGPSEGELLRPAPWRCNIDGVFHGFSVCFEQPNMQWSPAAKKTHAQTLGLCYVAFILWGQGRCVILFSWRLYIYIYICVGSVVCFSCLPVFFLCCFRFTLFALAPWLPALPICISIGSLQRNDRKRNTYKVTHTSNKHLC